MTFETGSIVFASDEDSKAIIFDGVYARAPKVVITAGPSSIPDLNVYVSNLSKLGCTLNLSDSPGVGTIVNYKILGK